MKLRFLGNIFLFVHLISITVGGPVKPIGEDEKLLEKSLQMRSFMNESVDPCENFYEFACGNWRNIYPANNDTNMETNYLEVINKAFDEKVSKMLMDSADPADTEIDKKVKNFYRSCMKLKDGVKPEKLIEVISEFGKMPALTESGWNEENFDWVETLAKIKHKYGYQIIIGLDILPDMRDNSKNRIYIGEAKFDLESKSMYLEPVGEDYRMFYRLGVVLKLSLLKLNYDIIETTANEIVDFEILLAEGMVEKKSGKNLNDLLVNTTVEEMQRKYSPTFDVEKFLKIILGEEPPEMIYEYAPQYLENLMSVIEKTEKRIVANYIFFQLLKRFALDESDTQDELAKNCLDLTKENFAKNLDNMIYRRYNNKATEDDVLRIFDELKALFRVKLQSSTELDWLSEKTRQAAIEKLEALKIEINSYVNNDFEKEFEGLETSEDDYVGNLKNITMLDTKRAYAKLHGPITPIDAGAKLSVTPANLLMENTVKIPVALLQPYFVWAENFPDALKFGITGFLLAHELIHAFDDSGSQFGPHGNLKDWWDEQSKINFDERRECFRDQYQNYVYGEKKLPRSELQSENIADNSGLKLAFEAYKNAREKAARSNQKKTDKMIGMEYTSRQLFFIGFAQFWCSDLEKFFINLQTEVDEHTPGKYRAIGTISNLKEFSEAFECEAGSEMNPPVKCTMY